MARDILESQRRAREREIEDLRAAVVELAKLLAIGNPEVTLKLNKDSGLARTVYREVNSGALTLEDVPAFLHKDVKAMVKSKPIL